MILCLLSLPSITQSKIVENVYMTEDQRDVANVKCTVMNLGHIGKKEGHLHMKIFKLCVHNWLIHLKS